MFARYGSSPGSGATSSAPGASAVSAAPPSPVAERSSSVRAHPPARPAATTRASAHPRGIFTMGLEAKESMRIRERMTTAGAALLLVVAPLEAQDTVRCAPNVPPPPDESPVTAAELCTTIAALADDSLEGRRAGTEEADRAARWIA